MKGKKLILFGDSAFAEIAYEYFTHDSDYEVVAFTVSREYIQKKSLFGLPIVPFEEVDELYNPGSHEMHIALIYNTLNRVREQFYNEAKLKGFVMANYVSSKAFIWHNVKFGDNCFIFEDNTLQPFVEMGNNNVLWSGNHIGHHTVIGSNNFISSHVVISGFCEIANANFIGVNSTIGNNLKLGSDCLIGSFVHIVKHVPDGSFIRGTPNKPDEITTWEKFKVEKFEMD